LCWWSEIAALAVIYYIKTGLNTPVFQISVIFTAKTVKMTMQQIGEIIRLHRKKSGLSREDCARLAGVGKTALFDMEHGKDTVQMDTLLKVLKVMNIELRLDSPLMKTISHENR
jgi:DNA-binding XRE family transcriptional regulator